MANALQVSVEVSEELDDKGKVSSPAASFTSTVEWTGTTASFDNRVGERVVLDFQKRERRRYDEQKRTVVTEPLHLLAGARDLEARNREHGYGVLKAGGVPDNDLAPVLVAHQLSVVVGTRKTRVGKRSFLSGMLGGPEIELTEREGHTVLTAHGRPLLSSSADGVEAPESVPPWVHFLRHEFGGHPVLLQRLVESGRLPRQLVLSSLVPLTTGGVVTVRLIDGAAAPRPPLAAPFEERLGLDGSDPIDAVLERSAPAAGPPSPEARLADALLLLRGPVPLAGLLAFFELSLEQGTALPPEFATILNASADRDLKAFLALLQPAPSEADAKAMLQAFEVLRSRAGAHAFLLAAFEAPVRRALGRHAEAAQMLTALLQTNPRVTGAWKDRGDLFAQGYDFTRAWRCWNRARALAPHFATLKDIAAFEARLEAEHPEYFRLR